MRTLQNLELLSTASRATLTPASYSHERTLMYETIVKCFYFGVGIDVFQTSNPCQNGGKYEDTAGGYKCTCKPGFTGKNRETGELSITDEV